MKPNPLLRKLTRRPALLAFALLLAWRGVDASGPVMLNFANAEIDTVVRAIGQISGKNFLVDPRVKGTLNIASVKPVSPELAYQILVSSLRMQGFAVVEGRGIVKVLPEADAKQHYSRTFGRAVGVGGDQVITQVYPLDHASATQLVAVLRPLIAPNNAISAYPGANILVITDYADNLKRISEIIAAIDKPNEAEFTVIRVQHLSAIELAQQLTRLFTEPLAQGQHAGPPGLTIAADVRGNNLLVRADSAGKLATLRELVTRLDVPSTGTGNLQVVHLRNADASKLAETLRALAAAETQAAPAPAAGPGAAGAGAATTGAAGATILADAPTNSLVIRAPDHVYNSLRAVIERLDTRRAQVFVEALIVEVTSDKAAEFGIQWQGPLVQRTGDFALVGGTNFNTGLRPGTGNNILSLATASALPNTGLNLALLQKFTLNGKTYEGLTALARALEQDADANILSTPNLLTLDNEEAKIVIGQNVPFITGSYSQAAGTTGAAVNPFQTIERKDVGLTLKVKPQVSEGGNVKLSILQEVSSVNDATQQGIITNKRAIETTVLVRDGEAIVLGGLIQDDTRQGMDKVPGLGNLPLLGGLFRAETRKRTKTNLMVFLRPVVVRDSDGMAQVTQDRYDYINQAHATFPARAHWLLGEQRWPALPDLKLDRLLAAQPRPAPQPTAATPAAAAGVAASPAPAPTMGWFD